MKIFHTSDWHLGRMLYGRSLLEDQAFFINQVFLPAVKEQRPDLVLLSGDIYDRQIAPVEALRLFDEAMSAIAELDVKIALISGNHDGADRLALMKPLLRRAGVYISTSLEDAVEPVTVEAGGERVQLFLVPFLDNAVVRDYFQEDGLRGEAACMERVLRELKPKLQPGIANLLLAHCFVSGSTVSDSESPMFVGGSGEIPAAILDDFDYVALGHLHGPQRVGGNGRYSGSPLKYSIDEEHHKKSFVILDIHNGTITHKLETITPKRDVRRITGMFEDILKAGKTQPSEDYVEIVLQDQNPVLMAVQRLSPYYPSLLTVRNNWAIRQADASRVGRKKDADEQTLFVSFMKDICGVDVDQGEAALFAEILQETR